MSKNRNWLSGCALVLAAATAHTACKTPGAGASSDIKEGFDSANNPENFGLGTVRYDSIPTRGRLSTVPWAGYYWATYRGGISYRWTQFLNRDANTLGNMSYRDFDYRTLGASQAQGLQESQIQGLSPSEKYDIYMGDYNFGLTDHQKTLVAGAARSNGGEIPTWFGMCHAWAPVAGLTPYPGEQVKIKNRNNQCVTFYRDDLKALMTAAYDSGFGASYSTLFLGKRCNMDPGTITRDSLGRIAFSECRDTNPGAFHTIMTSLITNNKPGVLDVTFSDEVWNQPIYGYDFQYSNVRSAGASDSLSSVRAPGTVKLVDVDFTMQYVVESSPSLSREDLNRYIQNVTYYYTLEVDSQDRIIGGEWRVQRMSNASVRIPDFVWAPATAVSNSGKIELAEVQKLVNLSLSGRTDYCSGAEPPINVPNPNPNLPTPVQPDQPTQPTPNAPNPVPQMPHADQVVVVPPMALKYSPFVDVRTLCPANETRFSCESQSRGGCIWFADSRKCVSIASDRCLDFTEENVCIAKGGNCKWKSNKCEHTKVLEQRQQSQQ